MAPFQDETLAVVSNYKELYDKTHPEFHRQDKKGKLMECCR